MKAAPMIVVIVCESKSDAEYARRAEAWAASESKPPSIQTMASRWVLAKYGYNDRERKRRVVTMILDARDRRVAASNAMFKRLIGAFREEK